MFGRKKVPRTPAENAAAKARGRAALSKRARRDAAMYERLEAKNARRPKR